MIYCRSRRKLIRQLAEAEESVSTEMYYVYVLSHRKFSKIYIGQTAGIEKRLELHRKKKFGSTVLLLDSMANGFDVTANRSLTVQAH